MASYNEKYNSDDSVIRHLIIGFLADLNNKVYFYRQLEENRRVVIDVPFYYSITGDDEFLRDAFLFSTPVGPDCVPNKAFADGNYESVPRGVANLTSIQIDSSKLVNRRNRGQYTRLDENGSMQGYTSEFEMIPITMGFDIEIIVSSQLDALKITEMLVKKMYKSNYFNVEVGHLNEGTYKLASYYAMPDDYAQERPIEYTFDGKNKYKITMSVELSSFLPSFDLGDGYDLSDVLGINNGNARTTTDAQGNITDMDGNLIDAQGNAIDAQGNIIGGNPPNPVTGIRRKSAGNTEMHIGNRMFEIRSTLTDQNQAEFKRGLLTDDVIIYDTNNPSN
jgi:hypothetical protein